MIYLSCLMDLFWFLKDVAFRYCLCAAERRFWGHYVSLSNPDLSRFSFPKRLD